MKSIIQDEKQCLLCGSPNVELHHCFFGSLRKISDQHGLTVWLCPEHHRGNSGVHFNRELDLWVKRTAQFKFEKNHSREEWFKIIGKNYL